MRVDDLAKKKLQVLITVTFASQLYGTKLENSSAGNFWEVSYINYYRRVTLDKFKVVQQVKPSNAQLKIHTCMYVYCVYLGTDL